MSFEAFQEYLRKLECKRQTYGLTKRGHKHFSTFLENKHFSTLLESVKKYYIIWISWLPDSDEIIVQNKFFGYPEISLTIAGKCSSADTTFCCLILHANKCLCFLKQ